MKKLKFISLLYLILPIIVFYLGYLKLYISIPLVIGLGFILYKSFKEKEKLDINKKTIKHKKYFNRTRKITHNKNLIFPKQKPK